MLFRRFATTKPWSVIAKEPLGLHNLTPTPGTTKEVKRCFNLSANVAEVLQMEDEPMAVVTKVSYHALVLEFLEDLKEVKHHFTSYFQK